MAITKICTYHHVTIKTPEEDMKHMGPMCIIYETGSGLGGIEAVDQQNRSLNEPVVYEEGVILPYDTQAEKDARMKGRGAQPVQ